MINKYNLKQEHFERVKSDSYGNPRFVLHFTNLITDEERETFKRAGYDFGGISQRYDYAVKKANKIGGRKYHNKSYGGGIVFSTYNLDELILKLNTL
jgi:hypothetical protein